MIDIEAIIFCSLLLIWVICYIDTVYLHNDGRHFESPISIWAIYCIETINIHNGNGHYKSPIVNTIIPVIAGLPFLFAFGLLFFVMTKRYIIPKKIKHT
jgi:hypothetical protein